jgi:hypothetical protein
VIGTASDPNHEYLRELGAEPVRYGAGLVERIRTLAPDGVSAVLDAIGGDALDVSIAVAAKERIVTVADRAGAARLGIQRIGTERSKAKLEMLTHLYEQGLLPPFERICTEAGAGSLRRRAIRGGCSERWRSPHCISASKTMASSRPFFGKPVFEGRRPLTVGRRVRESLRRRAG